MTRMRQHWDLASRICRRAASAALALAIVFVPAVVTAVAQAQSFKLIYQFKGGKDGARPVSDLTVDGAGNLYGATAWGGGTGGQFWLRGSKCPRRSAGGFPLPRWLMWSQGDTPYISGSQAR